MVVAHVVEFYEGNLQQSPPHLVSLPHRRDIPMRATTRGCGDDLVRTKSPSSLPSAPGNACGHHLTETAVGTAHHHGRTRFPAGGTNGSTRMQAVSIWEHHVAHLRCCHRRVDETLRGTWPSYRVTHTWVRLPPGFAQQHPSPPGAACLFFQSVIS